MTVNSEENSMRALNQKYLKKFIRKFWLQPIPETCEKGSPQSPGNMFAENTGNMFGSSTSSTTTLYDTSDDDDKYNSVEDGLDQMSSSTSVSTSPSKNKSSSRPYYKSHRRQPSYSNVDLIFLEVRKWQKTFFFFFPPSRYHWTKSPAMISFFKCYTNNFIFI